MLNVATSEFEPFRYFSIFKLNSFCNWPRFINYELPFFVMVKWEQRNRPIRLERRFEFESYDATRDFLERLGELSESKKIFPDISFGSTYVNITLRPESEELDAQFTDVEFKFASEIDDILD